MNHATLRIASFSGNFRLWKLLLFLYGSIGDYKYTEWSDAGEGSAIDISLMPLNSSVDDSPPHFAQGRPQLPWAMKVAFLAAGFLVGCAKPVFIGNVGAKVGSSGLVFLKKVHLKKPQDRWPDPYPLHDIASFTFSKGDEPSLARLLPFFPSLGGGGEGV